MANSFNKDERLLIIKFPSVPQVDAQLKTSKNERLALYDIITKAIEYKYTYETEKLDNKEIPEKNLNNIKVYAMFLSKINQEIRDPFMREYVLDTIKIIKNNNFSKRTVASSQVRWREPSCL